MGNGAWFANGQTGFWNDVPVTMSHRFICTRDGNADDSSTEQPTCGRDMIYWDGVMSEGTPIPIDSQYLSGVGTPFEQCGNYCASSDGCIGIYVTTLTMPEEPVTYQCYVNYDPYYTGPYCWGSNCQDPSNLIQTIQIGVFRDYYDSNPEFLPTTTPAGTIGTVIGGSVDGPDGEQVENPCDVASTGFGSVNYRKTYSTSYSTDDDKNVVRETGSNCAVSCFEKAGCSAFYSENGVCTFIIGTSNGSEESPSVTDSGLINDLCPASAFENNFTRRSQFYCILWSPNEAGDVSDRIVGEQTGDSNRPLRQWIFETTQASNPMMTSSQYITVEQPDLTGTERRYRAVRFSIETHIRVGTNLAVRKRRDANELMSAVELTMENDFKIHQQAQEESWSRALMMPRIDDILATIEAVEQQATSFILEGGLEMPNDIGVELTTEPEVVEFIQTAADGSVAADCASGSCECSAGYIDNGNSCEEMTVEQAATTQAPTTTQAPVDQPTEFLESLIGKLESVFEVNRPGKPRTHLIKKWKHVVSKTVKQYKTLQAAGCDFDDNFEDENVNFDTVDVCYVSFFVSSVV